MSLSNLITPPNKDWANLYANTISASEQPYVYRQSAQTTFQGFVTTYVNFNTSILNVGQTGLNTGPSGYIQWDPINTLFNMDVGTYNVVADAEYYIAGSDPSIVGINVAIEQNGNNIFKNQSISNPAYNIILQVSGNLYYSVPGILRCNVFNFLPNPGGAVKNFDSRITITKLS